jgi:hypothetical protein
MRMNILMASDKTGQSVSFWRTTAKESIRLYQAGVRFDPCQMQIFGL